MIQSKTKEAEYTRTFPIKNSNTTVLGLLSTGNWLTLSTSIIPWAVNSFHYLNINCQQKSVQKSKNSRLAQKILQARFITIFVVLRINADNVYSNYNNLWIRSVHVPCKLSFLSEQTSRYWQNTWSSSYSCYKSTIRIVVAESIPFYLKYTRKNVMINAYGQIQKRQFHLRDV